MIDAFDNRRRHEWIEQIIQNLELEEHDRDLLNRFNNQRLQYLARRSTELVGELDDIKRGGADTSLEFKTRKQIKKIKDSLITVIN